MSSMGNKIKIEIFGESHSEAIGMTLSGIPAGEKIDEEEPKNTEYFLTEKGRSFNKVFYELLLFAIENDKDNEHYSEHAKNELKEMYKEILQIE